MAGFICFFVMGTVALFAIQQHMNHAYFDQRKEILAKRYIADEINDRFQTAFFNMRGYLLLNQPKLKVNALNQRDIIMDKTKKLEVLKSSVRDNTACRDIQEFTFYYFDEILPPVIKTFESGDDITYKNIANNGATARINGFQKKTKAYKLSLDKQLDEKAVNLSRTQAYLQVGLITFIALLFILLMRMIRIIIRNIGRPLSDFAFAANEIAAGREAEITITNKRKDELGALAAAFKKMIVSVQDKEQDLMAQNQELFAQQDELQAQQAELEGALDFLTVNEKKLTRRNELINGISSSLDKEEVLYTIVENMCRLIDADCGMICLLQEDAYSSFGISDYGVSQFRKNLECGLNQRLIAAKKGFTVKREQMSQEKAFHENQNYSYDLYLPVLSASDEVGAIMVYSRYGGPFSENEILEYETLARQIAISLEKIKLYEQSEDNRVMNQRILNTVQEGIQLIDREGTIVQVNQKLCEIFGGSLTIKDIIGHNREAWTKLMAGQIEEPAFKESLDQAIHNAAVSSSMDTSFVYTSKENRVIKVYCEVLKNGEEVFGTVMVHRDITKEYAVDVMKSEFVSTVSHELRTPLASVLGFTELMMNKQLNPERQSKYLQTIYNEAKRLTALINDFLDVQRMESGKQMYEKKHLDILPVIQKIIGLQEISTVQHAINFEADAESYVILGDRSKIEQVFMNLISNAIKYSPNGGNIDIKVYSSGNFNYVEIKDFGLGIPEEAIPELFQKFYRVDNSDRRRIGGTGLGLSIVDEIMKAHDGAIAVSSEYGAGSIFTLSFPRVQMNFQGKSTAEQSGKLNYQVAVIEDDMSLADLIRHELLESGFSVNSYKNGGAALKSMASNPPDAVVLDIMLDDDEIDGWGIMGEMKDDDNLKYIPIFVSTALDEPERGFSLGAEDFLVKPYKPSQLSATIKQTLSGNEIRGQILVPQEK
ncbi:ATP-binding protein [Actinomycetes bacterium NPDC127524]